LSRPVTSHRTMPCFFILQPAASPCPIHFVLHPAASLPTLLFPLALLLLPCLATSPHLVVSPCHVAPLLLQLTLLPHTCNVLLHFLPLVASPYCFA
jgi:hypothetical protein